MLGGIPVRKSSLVPLHDPDGEPLMFIRFEDTILVHPDRWDEFQLWIRQPDIASHPDVRAIFRDRDRAIQHTGDTDGE